MFVAPKKAAIVLISTVVLSISLGITIRFIVARQITAPITMLSEIAAYAAELPEFPQSDDNDWTDPHFDAFNTQRDLSTWQKVALSFNLLKAPAWSPLFLAQQLKILSANNIKMGLADGKQSFIHLKAKPDTKIFIFGDVHAAFHSMIRDLQHLQSMAVLDNNLLVHKGNYLIINGDFIDRSAYSIDSLILLSLLLEKNPTNVFYIAGNHERDAHWQDYGLKRELVSRGYPYSRQAIPFKEEINNFFQTLPEAIYVSASDQSRDVLRIAFNEHLNLSYNEDTMSPAFLEQNEPIKIYSFTTNKSEGPSIDVRAAIKTEEWRISHRIQHGIGLLDQDHGATTWASLSSPIGAHKIFLNIHDDSFLEVCIKDSIEQSIIFSHFQDSRTLNGFENTEQRSLVFGGPAKELSHRPNIKIASSMSLIRGVPSMGKQALRGVNLAINQFNMDSINNNYTIRFYSNNDDYSPQAARKNVLESIDNSIRLFLLPTGTPTLMSYLDVIKKKEINVFFPITGAASLHTPTLENLIHFRSTYEQEVQALITTLVKEYGTLKFAFFYQDDSYGRGPFDEAIKLLKKFGISEYTALPYSRGAVSFKKQVELLKLSQADALGLFATATSSEEFIRQLGADFLSSTQLFGISFVGELRLRRFVERLGIKLMLASSVPNPRTFNEPIGVLYRQTMDKDNNSYDVFSFEAFVASSLFFHALNTVPKNELTLPKIMRALEKFAQKDFMGFPLHFNPKTRSVARYIWIEDNTKSNWSQLPITP